MQSDLSSSVSSDKPVLNFSDTQKGSEHFAYCVQSWPFYLQSECLKQVSALCDHRFSKPEKVRLPQTSPSGPQTVTSVKLAVSGNLTCKMSSDRLAMNAVTRVVKGLKKPEQRGFLNGLHPAAGRGWRWPASVLPLLICPLQSQRAPSETQRGLLRLGEGRK